MPRTCVLAGSTGLIGSHLLPALAPEWEIHALARRPDVALSAGAAPYAADLSAPFATDMLPRSVEAVIHVAQSSRFRDFPAAAPDIFGVNVGSVVRLLDYAHQAGARVAVIASSGGVYRPGHEAFTEDMEVPSRNDLGFYLGTKLTAEILAEQYARHMTVVVLRYFFVYGPGQRDDMLVPRLVHSIVRGDPVTLAGMSGLRLNPTYVADAVDATRQALELTTSERINVGGPEVVSLRALCEIIGERVGREAVFRITDAEPQPLVADVAKMTRLLGPAHITPKAGIDAYVSSLTHTPSAPLEARA